MSEEHIGSGSQNRQHAYDHPEEYPQAFLWGAKQALRSVEHQQQMNYMNADWEPIKGYLQRAIDSLES